MCAQFLRLATATTARRLAPLTEATALRVNQVFCSTSKEGADAERRKNVQKLLYRSKQRGILELDLLVGEYAEKHLPGMTTEELSATEELLTEENPDLWKWITLQAVAPPHLQQNTVFQDMQKQVAQQLEQLSPPETRAASGQAWLRGWDDWKKGQLQQQQADSHAEGAHSPDGQQAQPAEERRAKASALASA